jgi:hypothetical protein
MALWGKLILCNAIGGHPPGSFVDAWRQHDEESLRQPWLAGSPLA